MVKVKTLRLLQTHVQILVPNKHLSQARTLKRHKNPYNIYHGGRVTPFRGLKITNLLSRIDHKTNLVIPELVNKTCALILNLVTQKYADIDMCKNLFSANSVCHLHSLSYLFFHFFCTQILHLFLFRGHIDTNNQHQLKLMKLQHPRY